MGIFSKTSIGSMSFVFTSRTFVHVKIDLPEDHLVIFAFLYAAKLLVNMPDDRGRIVCARGAKNLQAVNDQYPFNHNGPILGVTSNPKVLIAGSNATSPWGKGVTRWVYSGELLCNKNGLLVDTRIAHGDEEHFHCAAIDTALEVARKSLGEKGGAVCAAAKGFFEALSRCGCSDLTHNYELAASAAAMTLEEASKPLQQESQNDLSTRLAECRRIVDQTGKMFDITRERLLGAEGVREDGRLHVDQLAATCLPSAAALKSDQEAVMALALEDDIKGEAMLELVFLRLFSADFGLVNGFNDDTQRERAIDAFNGLLRVLTQVSEYNYIGEYTKRWKVYRKVVSKEAGVPAAAKIANAFSLQCGSLGISLMALGGELSKDISSRVIELVRGIDVEFTDSEGPELVSAETTVRIEKGMTIDTIINLKGRPETHVDLGQKAILLYPDLKLIFKDGLLVDVE